MPANPHSYLWAFQRFAVDAAIVERFSGDAQCSLPNFDASLNNMEAAWSCTLEQDERDQLEIALLGVVVSTSVARLLDGFEEGATETELAALEAAITRHDAIAAAAAALVRLLKADGMSESPITCYSAAGCDLSDAIASITDDLDTLAHLVGEGGPLRETYAVLTRKSQPDPVGSKRSKGRPPVKDYWTELAQTLVRVFEKTKSETPSISPSSSSPHGYSGIFFRGVTALYEAVPRNCRGLQLQTLGSRCHQEIKRTRTNLQQD